MMDFVLEAWVSGLIELNKFEWVLGAGQPWKPGTEAQAAICGIQRNAEYGFGRARRGDAAAGSANPGRAESRHSA